MALQLVKLLETYRGRDRVMRLGTYIAMLIGGSGNSPFNTKFNIIAQEFNGCRTVLRLFDDLSMAAVNLKFYYGEKDKNPILRILDMMTNTLYQSYYIVEHIAWFADKKVINRSSTLWWVICIAIWAISLILEISKAVVKLMNNKKSQAQLRKQKYLDKDEKGTVSEQNQEINDRLKALKTEEYGHVLLIIQSAADLLNAINWLPPGVLWA
ncbi:hypothetical protein LOTGIDRAFT_235958, partial [Lottia gigantea]